MLRCVSLLRSSHCPCPGCLPLATPYNEGAVGILFWLYCAACRCCALHTVHVLAAFPSLLRPHTMREQWGFFLAVLCCISLLCSSHCQYVRCAPLLFHTVREQWGLCFNLRVVVLFTLSICPLRPLAIPYSEGAVGTLFQLACCCAVHPVNMSAAPPCCSIQ